CLPHCTLNNEAPAQSGRHPRKSPRARDALHRTSHRRRPQPGRKKPYSEQVIRYASGPGQWVLAATVLGSGMAFIDATIVNVALPTMGRQLELGFAGLQWTVNAYALTLSALLLLGGSLGDRFGRRRIFVIGVIWFAVASLACGLAPNGTVLIAA